MATDPPPQSVDHDGLLCALVLVPDAFARNRFFALFEDPEAKAVRRRAARVRGVLRQLLGLDRPKGEIVGEQVLEDGQVLLIYRVPELSYERSTALSQLEAAVLRYALHRAGTGEVNPGDRDRVRGALRRLGRHIDLPEALFDNSAE